MPDPRGLITDTLRGRVLRGVQTGTLAPGDRLPSARDLAGEFEVDYRLVIDAYKALEEERLVELRPRGGVYVAPRPSGQRGLPPLPDAWLAGLLADGLAREIPGPELHEWLRRATETLRLRAVAIVATADQAYGLSRELRDDFGFEADALLVADVRGAATLPLSLRRADLVVTTAAQATWVHALGASLQKPVTVVEVRPDLLGGEWALLLRRPVYAVVATAEFGAMLRRFFAAVPGIENLHVLVAGTDDLAVIPDDAPTYVTQGVRATLGDLVLRGRILPAARTISTESAREIFGFIVRSNIEAMSARAAR